LPLVTNGGFVIVGPSVRANPVTANDTIRIAAGKALDSRESALLNCVFRGEKGEAPPEKFVRFTCSLSFED
jgi:hypothetical protein